MSFHQETALAAGGDLVVFPSNHELTIRAHGMAPTTLRRHLAALVEAGLVIRRDSPNGKRYARKGQGGAIEQAFGFDLAPLVARAAEFETLAEDVRAQRRADALMREQITLLRRDTAKSIEAGLTEGIPAPWADYATQLMGLSQGLLRTFQPPELTARLDALRALYRAVANSLENITKSNKSDANESQDGRHNQNSNSDPIGFEPASEESRRDDRSGSPAAFADAKSLSARNGARRLSRNSRLDPGADSGLAGIHPRRDRRPIRARRQSERLGGRRRRHGRAGGRGLRRGDPAAGRGHQEPRRLSARVDRKGEGGAVFSGSGSDGVAARQAEAPDGWGRNPQPETPGVARSREGRERPLPSLRLVQAPCASARCNSPSGTRESFGSGGSNGTGQGRA